MPGDPLRTVIDLRTRGVGAVLVIDIRSDDDDGPALEASPLEPGIAIVALPWTPGATAAPPDQLGLWSSTLRNPPLYVLHVGGESFPVKDVRLN